MDVEIVTDIVDFKFKNEIIGRVINILNIQGVCFLVMDFPKQSDKKTFLVNTEKIVQITWINSHP